MTTRTRRALAGLVLTTVVGWPLAAQETAVFRAGVQTVAVYATVRDASGHLVTNLTKDDFEIFDDRQARDITAFSTDLQPLSVAVMLDGATMMFAGIPAPSLHNVRTRAAVLAFVDALRPEDRASIGSFGLEIAVGARLTRDLVELTRVLDEEIWGGGGSPLWQAIRAASSSLAEEAGRRVVLTFTRGRDTGSHPALPTGRSQTEVQLLREQTMLYAVLMGTDQWLSDDLVRMTESSGGGHVLVPSGSDPKPALAQVAEELRHQYLVGFEPRTADGRVHSIELRATRPGLKVRAKRSYVAEAPQ